MVWLLLLLAVGGYFVGIYRGLKAGRLMGRAVAEREFAHLLEMGAY